MLPTRKSAAELASGGATQATLYSFEGAGEHRLDASSGVTLTDAALNQAMVAADVPATNGVIHVIDKVLVPPGVLNVVQMAQTNPTFSVLVEAVVAANLADALSAPGPFTVFAPTNDAFVALGRTRPEQGRPLLANPRCCARILTYHVVSGRVRAPTWSRWPSRARSRRCRAPPSASMPA